MRAERTGIDGQRLEELEVADRHGWPSTVPTQAFPGDGFEIGHVDQRDASLARAGDNRAGERMLADPLQAGDQTDQLRLLEAAVRHDGHQPRFALGQGAGLVHDQRRHLLQNLERLGVADQHARFGPASRPDHDRHGRRETQRARAGNDQHGDRIHQRVRETRLGSVPRPRR